MKDLLSGLLARAAGANARVAVAAAHDEEVLEAVAQAQKSGVCRALLFGGAQKTRAILTSLGENADDFTIVEPGDGSDERCAQAAVDAVLNGDADFLMKGILNTTVFLRAVVHSALVLGSPLSHVMFFELPTYPKALALTDGAMNPAPDFARKKAILENAAGLLRLIGYETINAACLSGSEVVSEKIPSTVEAAALAALDWSAYRMNVIGPVALDLAISPASCKHKRYSGAGAGDADLLLAPNYETGNALGKSLVYFANARTAGLVVGAKCPIVLVSRNDTAEAKLYSIALAAVASKGDVSQ